jgi:opacity protein-like surface antigen
MEDPLKLTGVPLDRAMKARPAMSGPHLHAAGTEWQYTATLKRELMMTFTTTPARARRWATVSLLIGALGLFGVGEAAGQQPTATTAPAAEGPWTVTPFIGFGFSGDLDSATGAFGVAGGYQWSPRVTIEGELNFLPSSETSGLIEVDSHVWSLTGNLVYHFANRPFIPYGVFGIGFGQGTVDVSPPLQRPDSSSKFVVNFGGGVERAIRERVRFRGDMRYFFGGDLVPDYWRVAFGLSFDLGRR